LPHAFPTAEESATQAARAKSVGDIRGEIAGYTEMFTRAGYPDAAKRAADLVAAQHTRAGQAPFQSVSGEYTDPLTGKTVQGFGSFNRFTARYEDAAGRPLVDFRRVIPVAMGQWFEQAARKFGFPRGSDVPPEHFDEVNATALALRGQMTDPQALA